MAEADTFPAGVGGAGAGAGRSGGGGAREGPKAGARSVDKCSACWSGEVMEDPWLGAAVCQQCGHVAADSMLQEHLSFVGSGSQPLGTMVTDAEVAEGFWSDRRAGGQDEAEEEAKGTVERLPAHRQTAKVAFPSPDPGFLQPRSDCVCVNPCWTRSCALCQPVPGRMLPVLWL